ncbi:MAG: alpha/beta fold hydrolase [Candidatus Marinimicrobia bacterium]|nr:alpha/beta fold hydrolase [Candidatus Neomarinimicrobiota bacterium]MCF7850264.1 alpha/beta fold hydrolase [Candidatus Neomarinimicrobiota bacterium]MCF7903839.1 alpha/beta fold hydrolase [Candidatus Neomarinimicrobiota bacterium]
MLASVLMVYLLWTLLIILLFYSGIQIFIRKVYAFKPVPHKETPAKFGIPFDEVRFKTENDKTLYGWWIPAVKHSETAPTLILAHGLYRNLGYMLRYIQNLHPLGYNLLTFDSRHHGSSDRDDHASMYKIGQDITHAVRYLESIKVAQGRFGAIGISLGGAGSVYAASLEPSIKAVVTVGAPAHPVDVMYRRFREYYLPGFVVWYALRQIEKAIGVSFDSFAPETNIAKAKAHFLIIHGEEDQVVLHSQGEKLKKAGNAGQCELWSLDGYGHSNCHHHPDFWNRVHTFLIDQLT